MAKPMALFVGRGDEARHGFVRRHALVGELVSRWRPRRASTVSNVGGTNMENGRLDH